MKLFRVPTFLTGNNNVFCMPKANINYVHQNSALYWSSWPWTSHALGPSLSSMSSYIQVQGSQFKFKTLFKTTEHGTTKENMNNIQQLNMKLNIFIRHLFKTSTAAILLLEMRCSISKPFLQWPQNASKTK